MSREELDAPLMSPKLLFPTTELGAEKRTLFVTLNMSAWKLKLRFS